MDNVRGKIFLSRIERESEGGELRAIIIGRDCRLERRYGQQVTPENLGRLAVEWAKRNSLRLDHDQIGQIVHAAMNEVVNRGR